METNDMTSKEIKNTAPVPSPKPPRKRLKKIVTGCLIAAAAVVLYGFFGPNFLLPYTSGYLHVRSDMTAADVGDALTDKGYIASPLCSAQRPWRPVRPARSTPENIPLTRE